ncbi:hypothetical protein O988_05201, partial [Pseudogymnoascus sp. VKM F-3808]
MGKQDTAMESITVDSIGARQGRKRGKGAEGRKRARLAPPKQAKNPQPTSHTPVQSNLPTASMLIGNYVMEALYQLMGDDRAEPPPRHLFPPACCPDRHKPRKRSHIAQHSMACQVSQANRRFLLRMLVHGVSDCAQGMIRAVADREENPRSKE